MMSKRMQIFLFFLFLFAVLTNFTSDSWSDSSRLATIQSLVESHSFIIDKSQFIYTGDKYFYQGHFYSDKPPILALYASIFYCLMRLIGINFHNHYHLTYYLLTLLVVGVPTCIGLVYFYKILKIFKVDDLGANIILLVTSTGSLILPYSTVINNHTVAGVLLLIGFYYLIKMQESISIKVAFLVGFLVTLAGSIDISAFLFIPFFAIAFINKPLKLKVAFIFACTLLLFVYFYINIYTSGSLTPPAMNKPLWDYPGSAFSESTLSGLSHYSSIFSQGKYAFHMLLGNRGLLSYTPILLFSIFGFAKVILNREFQYRKEYILIILASFTYILMYIFRSNNYSGSCYGVRWYADLMFLLFLPLAHIIPDIQKSKSLRISFFMLAFISIFISFIGTIYPFSFPGQEDDYSSFIGTFIYVFQTPGLLIKFRNIVIAIVFCYVIFRLNYFYKTSFRAVSPFAPTNR